ncbi:MAG: 5-methylcytosine-specific restriction enzyme [Cyanobacteriota bacterium erpe_2018_sw_21hr_WHONDRS-SW48-000092_B_bin.40]|jgi:5-methylcytosine-specific restriction protein B|nr:5-methylcytosine-specific restriction enzyme [Cyanobacteriota bacterium erpe_2018_sw_21hr_WHONDRS-SW48-000092_B_bin.40]
MPAIDDLTKLIADGLPSKDLRSQTTDDTKSSIDAIFGQRYQAKSPYAKRAVLTPTDDQIQFAGLVHQDSPNSGVYGGMSLIWFPIAADGDEPACSLLTLVCGTRGLSPDEQILGRPGHVRHLRALQRYLKKHANIDAWVKPDPTNLSEPFPKMLLKSLQRFESVLKRYGSHIYFCAKVPSDFAQARTLVAGLLDFYAWERNWHSLKSSVSEIESFKVQLRAEIFLRVTKQEIIDLLLQRRFVILQGPPGTGKTRMANEILQTHFQSHGFSVQFHPSVSYETFVAGISPRIDGDSLQFQVKSGWLVDAIHKSQDKPFLFHADEINRADLARVLGEAIYLFEPGEIAQGAVRQVKLPQALADGSDSIAMPYNFYLLGTMNTADRSIAIMDMAVRRRFAFVDMWPDIDVVSAQNIALATESFALLQDIFAQHASDESFALMPGHSYFLADDESKLRVRLKYELLPLLREYLSEGRLATFGNELRTYVDWLDNEVR